MWKSVSLVWKATQPRPQGHPFGQRLKGSSELCQSHSRPWKSRWTQPHRWHHDIAFVSFPRGAASWFPRCRGFGAGTARLSSRAWCPPVWPWTGSHTSLRPRHLSVKQIHVQPHTHVCTRTLTRRKARCVSNLALPSAAPTGSPIPLPPSPRPRRHRRPSPPQDSCPHLQLPSPPSSSPRVPRLLSPPQKLLSSSHCPAFVPRSLVIRSLCSLGQGALGRDSVWRESPTLCSPLRTQRRGQLVFTAGKGPEQVGFDPRRSTEVMGCI